MSENLKKLLLSFVSNDNLRTKLMRPFLENDTYFASDANTLIAIPKHLITQDILLSEGYKMEEILYGIKQMPPIEFNLAAFEKQLIPDMVSDTDECDACDGTGYITDNRLNEYVCLVCDGECTIESESKILVPDPYKKFKVINSLFVYRYLDRLIKCCKTLNADSFTVDSYDAGKTMRVRIGEVYLLIMPIHEDPLSDAIEIKPTLTELNQQQ